MRHRIGMAATILALFPALAGADKGVFPGSPPLVRLRWPAVATHFQATPVPSPTEVIVLQDGTVTRLESYDGSPFLLRHTRGVPQSVALLKSELARWKIATLRQTCQLTFTLGGTFDRIVVPLPGKPVRLTWYNSTGSRTTDIVLQQEAGPPACSQEVVNAVGAVLSYVSFAERNEPVFRTGFLPRGAASRRVLTGQVHCGNSPAGFPARVRLHEGLPYDCVPEACFFTDPPLLDEMTTAADGRFTLTVPAGTTGDLWVLAEPQAACAAEFGQSFVSAEPLNDIEVRIDSFFSSGFSRP